jgi:hypothetical protein
VLIFRAASLADNLNSTEFIRYIRKRKFGQKRRSIIVKRRIPIKNEPIITNNDDEHSQEYVSRRRISTINESIKEEEEEEENKTIPKSSSPKLSLNQPTFKQLKLDQFLKVVQPIENSTNEDISQLNSEINNEDIYAKTRRITRNTRLHSTSKSETDLVKIENEISNKISDDGVSIASSNDTSNTLHSSPLSNMDRPITLKKRTLTSSNIQALIDSTISPVKVRIFSFIYLI